MDVSWKAQVDSKITKVKRIISLPYEKIEGVIQVPKGSQYLFLTPFSETAIDVDGRVLTNNKANLN